MKRITLLLLTILLTYGAWACTSFIISGKATPSGKPAMFKHRDTGELNNRIAYFQGKKYAFIGLMNSPMLDGEVWSGMNEAGFCIMNTASYNLREDTLDCQMDREGIKIFLSALTAPTRCKGLFYRVSFPSCKAQRTKSQ